MSKKKGGDKKKKEKKETPLLNLAEINIPNAEKDSLKAELILLKMENAQYKDEIFQLNEDIRIENLLNVLKTFLFYQSQLYKKLLENKNNTETNFENTQKQLEELKQGYQVEISKTKEANKNEFNGKLKQIFLAKQDQYVYDSSIKERQIDEIKFKLVDYQEFRDSEAHFLQVIADLEAEKKKLQWNHHEDMREKEKNFYREKSRMEGIYREKVEEQSKNAYKQAQEEVREIESHIDQKNVVLFEELKGHQKVIGTLKGENKQIQEKHLSIRRDLQLNQDDLNEYDQINLRNHKQIQSLKAQLNYVRHFIASEVHSYTKQIETEKQKAKESKDHLTAQIQILTQNLYEENLKYGKAKVLAKTVLEQRALTESYFMDSMEQPITHGASSDPSCSQPTLGKSKIDLESLDSQEKLKVLRVLYYKVKQGRKKIDWGQMIMVKSKEATENKNETVDILHRLSKDTIDR